MNNIRLDIMALLTLTCLSCNSTVYGPGTTKGQIFVDTPEVFTRERIVNDRFEQVSWLEKQLRRADQPMSFNLQGLRQQGTALGISASGNVVIGKNLVNPGTPSADTPPKGTEGQQPATDTGRGFMSTSDIANPSTIGTTQANVTPIDSFRDMLAYREEVRSEMIEAQLDDRHDIKGNTLYRFKFDATILPEHDTSAWAVIRARFQPTLTEGKDLDDDIQKLYGHWITHMQKQITNAFSSMLGRVQNEEGLPSEELQDILDFIEKDFRPGAKLKDCENRQAERRVLLQSTSLSRDMQTILDKADAVNRLSIDPNYMNMNPLQQTADIIQEYLIHLYGNEFGYRKYMTFCKGNRAISVQAELDRRDTVFKQHIIEATAQPTIYSYAVTPKESVQRISDIGSRREVSDLLLKLSAISGTVQTSSVLKLVKETEGLYNAIQRQPLIVGFADANGTYPGAIGKGHSQIGWLVGPKFALSADGTRAGFRHTAIQNSLSASISIPGWWAKVKILIDTCWLGQGGVSNCKTEPFKAETPQAEKFQQGYDIRLPQDVSALDNLLGQNIKRTLQIRDAETVTLRVGEPGAVLLTGSNLWRSTVVTVGPWRSDRIVILPNMEGIIADFDKETTAAWFPTEEGKTVSIRIWTSEGSQPAGKARIKKGSGVTDGIVAGITRYVVGTPLQLIYADANLLAFNKLSVGIRKNAQVQNPWQFTDDVYFRGSNIVATINTKCGGCFNGDPIDIAIKSKSTPNSDDKVEILKEHPVLYLTEDDAMARIRNGATNVLGDLTLSLKNAPLQVIIRFPANSQKAFVNFDPGRLTLKATPTNQGPKIQIAPLNCKPDGTECTYLITPTGAVAAGTKAYSLAFEDRTDVPIVKDNLILAP